MFLKLCPAVYINPCKKQDVVYSLFLWVIICDNDCIAHFDSIIGILQKCKLYNFNNLISYQTTPLIYNCISTYYCDVTRKILDSVIFFYLLICKNTHSKTNTSAIDKKETQHPTTINTNKTHIHIKNTY